MTVPFLEAPFSLQKWQDWDSQTHFTDKVPEGYVMPPRAHRSSARESMNQYGIPPPLPLPTVSISNASLGPPFVHPSVGHRFILEP